MARPRDEALYWEAQVDDLRRDGLKTVRDSAARWQAMIAGLLGAFGSAAFIKGPSTFKDLGVSGDVATPLIAWLLGASVLAFLALYCTGRATMSIPKVRYWSGKELWRWRQDEAVASIWWLRVGRLFTLVAAGIVITGSFVAMWISLHPPTPAVNALVKRADGAAMCGTLDRPSALRLTVQGASYDLRASDLITIVDRCPQ